jgi:probable HAF family extracellular repeat protein
VTSITRGTTLLAAALALLLAAPARASDPFFTGVGDLAGGTALSSATGVSGDGSVVCGYSNSTAGDQAFRWTLAGGLEGLGDLPGGASYSNARAISADGSTIVGDSVGSAGGHAFRWRAPGPHSGGMQDLGDLPQPDRVVHRDVPDRRALQGRRARPRADAAGAGVLDRPRRRLPDGDDLAAWPAEPGLAVLPDVGRRRRRALRLVGEQRTEGDHTLTT